MFLASWGLQRLERMQARFLARGQRCLPEGHKQGCFSQAQSWPSSINFRFQVLPLALARTL